MLHPLFKTKSYEPKTNIKAAATKIKVGILEVA
jgi:hypothetical protein